MFRLNGTRASRSSKSTSRSRTGAVSDPENALGLTNFMGEMLLRGTNKRTKEQIDLAIDQLGAQLGVETRSEALIIRGAVLSSQLEGFLSLIQELITQSNFPEQRNRETSIRRRIPDSRGRKQRPDSCGPEVHRVSFWQPSLRKTDYRKDERPSVVSLATKSSLTTISSSRRIFFSSSDPGTLPRAGSRIGQWASPMLFPKGTPVSPRCRCPKPASQERLLARRQAGTALRLRSQAGKSAFK